MSVPPGSGGNLNQAVARLGADLLAVQEVDHGLLRTGRSEQMRDIAQSMNAPYWAFAPSIIGTPGEIWRPLDSNDQRIITESSPRSEGGYGIGIASKIPVKSFERIELGNSPIGMPLIIPGETESGQKMKPRFIYVRDEPRVALVAHLENGWTIITTHLSFVPGFNVRQLNKLKKFSGPRTIIMGDLNLPKNLPIVGSQWKSLILQNTYPSWSPKIQFDYILTKEIDIQFEHIATISTGISDHLPISVSIT